MATWTNPNELISTTSSTIPTAFRHQKAVPSFRTCIPLSRKRSALKRRCFGVVSCSFAPMESAKIKVVGVGGGGNNAVNRMIGSGLHGVDFYAIKHGCSSTITVCCRVPTSNWRAFDSWTRDAGTGGNPLLGEQAAEESKEAISNALKGSDLVFITAGMGGGTGSGAAPVVAQISKEAGYLTVGVVTYPFSFEGRKRSLQAGVNLVLIFISYVGNFISAYEGSLSAFEAIDKLQKNVDTLIVIPNDRLLDIADEQTPLQDAFLLADDVLRQGVQGISDIITIPGLGFPLAKNRAEEAAEQATLAPLIGSSIQSATGVVYNITGGKDITLQEVNRVSQVVTSLADPAANIIFGAVVDDRYNGEIHVTIIATGFSQSFQKTLLTDPKAAKLLDKVAGGQESRGIPLPLKPSTSPPSSSSKPSPRKLFF
ncbi:unnamed protein product [Prunus armeniaca]|uniref:Tubulin/FtsZ GTPase domain-containing protein n=1 Tax=Prunus armeniaca TaxID=36596 RepID=A0A6J5XC98_PRUAR|nr:unnamed protein product [Prunus armeniaca]